ARGRSGVRAVEVADGTRIACDLLVTAVGWTAPTSLLNASGDRPVYSPQAARFFPDVSRLPEDVLVTGGIAGDGTLDELTAHAAAIGALAASRASDIARARMLAPPTRAEAPIHPGAPAGARETAPAPVPDLPVYPHPELFAGRTNGFVDFSEDVSA